MKSKQATINVTDSVWTELEEDFDIVFWSVYSTVALYIQEYSISGWGSSISISASSLYSKNTAIQKIRIKSQSGNASVNYSLLGFIAYRVVPESLISDYLELDGSNANTTLDIGSEEFIAGKAKIGDDINYTEIKSDGEILQQGTARTVNALWLPASGLKAPGAKPAIYISHGLDGAWSFGNAITANQESVSSNMRLPLRMDRTVAPSVVIGWSAAGISPGNCKWQLEYLWTAPNESTIGVAQEVLTVVSTASSISNGLVVVEITGIDLPSATDACLHFKITRLSGDAQDTIAGSVEGLGLCFNFTADKLGLPT